GAGQGLSASLARLFAGEGMQVALTCRHPEKVSELCDEIGAQAYACDASQPDQVNSLFADLNQQYQSIDTVVYNPSARVRGPLPELDTSDVERAISVTAFGGFLIGQQAAKKMLEQSHGTILFTGASASVKGYAQSAPFAMGKFALRGLAQSMARELAPKNIHVAHFIIDGGIRSATKQESTDNTDALLDPDAIARSYLDVLRQHRSAWTWEMELRPWVEKF
ncbi:MAG: SDR family NAD(P)-dependent oxidoreductase, partial [Gammaproteobacteria bacterium]|nr:SDR family NAD(P)-dependent oxidoreductase [Gammaproteobacteria bacterium]